MTDYFTKLPSTAEPQHFPACLRWYEPVDIPRRPSRPVERPRRCTEITSKQASGSNEQASGSGEQASGSSGQASGSGGQASGSGGQASGSEESGDPKPTTPRGGYHS